MNNFAKPKVVISKCITFAPVRFDGQIISSNFVEKLKPYVDFIPVCPEIEIGLGVPRDPVRIVIVNGQRRLIQPTTRIDFTDRIEKFALAFLDSLDDVEGFILKRGSPSSGLKNIKIYGKIEKSPPIGRGPGFFGDAVLKKFPNLATEDEMRLINIRIREHFLTKLFTLARFREVKQSGKIRNLIDFHSANKYLLTAYSQKELKVLGNITANIKKRQLQDELRDYEDHLSIALTKTPSKGSYVNVMMKILGYFSYQLTKDEKTFFIESVEKYRSDKLPLSSVFLILRAWIIRFKEQYLSIQSILEPYPEQLIELESTFVKPKNNLN